MDELTITSKMNGRNDKVRAKSGNKQKVVPNQNFKKVLDQVTIKSPRSQRNSGKTKKTPEIRQDLVNKYRSDLSKGKYDIKSLEIADKIIQKIRDERSKFQF